MFLDSEKPIEKHRHHLPHWQQENTMVFVTWRLADSLPESVTEKIRAHKIDWEKNHPKPWSEEELKEYNRLFTLRLEMILDDCHGSCCLGESSNRQVLIDAFFHFDFECYVLDSFVIMPNHVHVLFSVNEGHRMEDIVHSWKRHTSREINKARNRSGTLWQAEYWDRLIRSQTHLDWTRRYIERNPISLPPNSYYFWSGEYGEGV